MRKQLPLAAIALSVALSACSLAPQFARPKMDMPQGWNDASGIAMRSSAQTGPFWEELGSTELDQLIELGAAEFFPERPSLRTRSHGDPGSVVPALRHVHFRPGELRCETASRKRNRKSNGGKW